MKRLNMEQGSAEWLKWRKTVITATDCPAILGSSPWQTPYKCWQRKLGLVDEQPSNAAMDRGRKLEPEARALFIQECGIHFEPACVESDQIEILGASLDGINAAGNLILEIKCGGENLHNQAQHGIIPDYYLDQMQHQLLVTGAEKCYYYSYNGKSGTCIEVLPDPNFAPRFLPIARAFWKSVAFFEPPALSIKDYRDMNDNLSWKEYTDIYLETDAQIKALEDKKEYVRKKIIELCDGQSCQGSGLKVMSVIMKGRVDYEKIPEISNLDLNKYRKASTQSWKFLIDK